MAQCPAHDDRNPSLSVGVGEFGRALVHCHAGCDLDAVLEALGLSKRDLFPASNGALHNGSASATKRSRSWPTLEAALTDRRPDAHWVYRDAEGEPVGAVLRFNRPGGDKACVPLSRVGDAWAMKAMPAPRPLYLLPTLLAKPGEPVYVVEGEKCADALAKCGLLATTSAGGCKAAGKTDWSPLVGRDVVLLPDNDEAGERYARDVAELARKAGSKSIRVARLADAWPECPPGGDVADELGADGPWSSLDDADIRARIEALAEPVEADDDADDAAPFPIERAFPDALEPLRDYIEAVAEAQQVPCEAVALLGVAIASTGILRKIEVDCGGWIEPAPLWALVLLPSGERKSALFRELVAPIVEWQHAEAKRLASDIARAESARKILAAQLKQAEDVAAQNGETADHARAAELAAQRAAHKPISAPRLLVGESTPEALALSMARNGERALVAGAEGDAVDVVMGRYSERPNMSVFLHGHAGDALTQQRIGRESVSLDRPALALALIVQPEAMRAAFESPAARGRGLLARFLACAPESRIGRRAIRPAPVPDDLRERAWTAPLLRMLNWRLPDPEAGENPIVARLDAEGRRLLDGFRERLEPRLCPRTGDLGAEDVERAWASKLPGALARLALLFECFAAAIEGREAPPTIVRAATVRAALAWAPWLIDSRRRAERVALTAGDAVEAPDGLTPQQRKVVAWIAEQGGTATPRDLARGPRRFRGSGGMTRAEEALQELAEAGVGECQYQRVEATGPSALTFILDAGHGGDGDRSKHYSRGAGNPSLSPSRPSREPPDREPKQEA